MPAGEQAERVRDGRSVHTTQQTASPRTCYFVLAPYGKRVLVTLSPVVTHRQGMKVNSVTQEPRKEYEAMTYREPHDFPSQEYVPGFWWADDIRQPGFMRNVLPPSTWDDRALAHISEHIAIEARAGAAYDAFSDVEDPQIKYLAALIATDEHRHHQMLSDIASALQAAVSARLDGPPTARPVQLSADRKAALLEQARQLLEIEESDAGELKKLHRDLHSAPDEAIWPLLIEIMELDTAKHIRILKGIERHLTRDRWPH